MSLELQPVYNDMVRMFTTSTNASRFTYDFVAAFNNVMDEFYAQGVIDTAPTHVDAAGATSDDVGSRLLAFIKVGLAYHLILLGQKHAGMELTNAKSLWDEALGKAMVVESREDMSTVDSDGVPTDDIAGLGYTGDL